MTVIGVYVDSVNVTLGSTEYTLAGYPVGVVPTDYGKDRTISTAVPKPTTPYVGVDKETTTYEDVV